MGCQARKQSSLLNKNFWDHHTVFSVSLLLSGDSATSDAEHWKMEGLFLVVAVVGGCRWSSVDIQGI